MEKLRDEVTNVLREFKANYQHRYILSLEEIDVYVDQIISLIQPYIEQAKKERDSEWLAELVGVFDVGYLVCNPDCSVEDCVKTLKSKAIILFKQSLSGHFRSNGKLKNIVSGGIIDTINVHGSITKELVNSATRRITKSIWGSIKTCEALSDKEVL